LLLNCFHIVIVCLGATCRPRALLPLSTRAVPCPRPLSPATAPPGCGMVPRAAITSPRQNQERSVVRRFGCSVGLERPNHRMVEHPKVFQLFDELRFHAVRDEASLMAHGKQAAHRGAAALAVVERQIVDVHPDEPVRQPAFYVPRELHGVI
jgi:hypothetical protein